MLVDVREQRPVDLHGAHTTADYGNADSLSILAGQPSQYT
jgi:hypothetical protein